MKAIRIKTHIDSETLHLPQLREWIGRDVDITVQSRDDVPTSQAIRDPHPLRGSVLQFDEPFKPLDESEWDASR